jgi:L-lactate utilization protein LutC
MGKGWQSSASAAVCLFCILFGAGLALGVIDIPDKLKDIPLYQGSKVQQAIDMENYAMIVASVKAKVDAIADFYKNMMVEKGWKFVSQSEQKYTEDTKVSRFQNGKQVFQSQSEHEDTKVVHFQKDKQVFQLTVSIDKKAEETTYTLMLILR